MADSDDIEKQVEEFRKGLEAKKAKGSETSIWVRDGDGPAIQVTGKRADNALAKFGDLFDDPAPAGSGDGDGGDGDGGEEKPARSVFGKKLGSS